MQSTSGGNTRKRMLNSTMTQDFKKAKIPKSTKLFQSVNSKKKQAIKQPDDATNQISTRNSYEILENDVDAESVNADAEFMERVISIEEKPTPIVVLSNKILELKFFLNSLILPSNFQIKPMKVGIRVNIFNLEDHKKVVEGLKTQKFDFYLYHNKYTKPLKIVLYGLYKMTDNEIEEELLRVSVFPEKIRPLNIKKPLYDNQTIYLLYFKPGSVRLEELRKIKAINQIVVRWERYQPKKYNNVAQCRNCQRLGHSSENCYASSRCVLCAGSHKSESCEKKISRLVLKQQIEENPSRVPDRSFVKCVLCGKNHTANYLGCQERKKFLEIQQIIVEKNSSVRRHKSIQEFVPSPRSKFSRNNFTHNNQLSWAQVAAETPQKQNDEQILNTLHSVLATMQQMMNQMSQMMNLFIQSMSRNE